MLDLNKLTRKFLIGEWKENPTINGYIQSVNDILSSFRPKTIKEKNKISVAKQQMNEIKKLSRKLQERVKILEEQIHVLEENREKKIDNE